MANQTIERDVLELVYSGCYDAKQQIGDGPIEPYEGCAQNIVMAIESGESIVTLLDPSNPNAEPDTVTYSVSYSTFFGLATIFIWEI